MCRAKQGQNARKKQNCFAKCEWLIANRQFSGVNMVFLSA
ncbi:hypothetical protein PSPO_b0289 [Pseudoalteromonas spongiae UST010723-006]|nr:hypothetical protein PSPO_b0289 [Pseudoalteromonas spongiae UST010723-006]